MNIEAVNDVYQQLAHYCREPVLSPPLANFPADSSCRRLPANLDDVVAQLRQSFADELLTEAGILRPAPGGELVVNPDLVPEEILVFAWGRPNVQTVVIARGAALCRRHWSVAAVLADLHLQRLHERGQGRMFITLSQADFVAALSLGLPAVPAEDFDGLEVTRRKEFCGRLRLPATPPFSSRYQNGDPAYPILVAWSLSELTSAAPPGVAAVQRFFAGLEQHLGIDLRQGGVWRPTEEDLEGFRFAARHGDGEEFRHKLLTSARHLEPFYRSPPRRDSSKRFVNAYPAWTAAARAGVSMREVAWEKYAAAVETDLVAPLLAAAEALQEPAARNLGTAVAQCSRLFHLLAGRANGDLGRSLSHGDEAAASAIDAGSFRQILALSTQILRLSEGLESCRGIHQPTSRPPQ